MNSDNSKKWRWSPSSELYPNGGPQGNPVKESFGSPWRWLPSSEIYPNGGPPGNPATSKEFFRRG